MKRVLLSILLFVAAAGASAQDDLRARIEPLVVRTMREHQIPGLAIGVIRNGRVVYANGFGVAKLGTTRPVTTKSLFHMASVTKPFVATAIVQLVEQGKLKLDEHLTTYLPYFRMKDPRYRDITIRQVLGHIAGLPDVEDYHWDAPEYDDGALERYVRGLSKLSLIGAPGEKYAYSNIGFEILGDVIAKLSGETFEGYVQRHILTPLGMTSSTLLIREADPALLTTPHVESWRGVRVSKVFPYNRPHAASSTLDSNIDDMTRWALANLNRGTLDGHRILETSSYDLLWTPQADTGKPGRKVGLSWVVLERNGHRIVSHAGEDDGFQSFIALAPDDGAAVIVMNNLSSESVHYPHVIGDAVLDMVLSH